MRRLGALGVVLALAGCAIDPKVPRVYEGKVVLGPYVPPEAYSAYLRGVLAEEAGDLKSALAAYEETIREDDEDPEPFTRIGDVRCRIDPKDRGADEQFAQAAAIDAHYAPLLVARARCAAARGQDAQAIAWVDAVSRADRSQPSIEALWVSLAKTPAARARVIALTVAAGEHVVAWDALIAWARAHDDAPLLAEGLIGLVKLAPLRAHDVEAGALELLGAGQTVLARRVAAAIADAPSENGIQSVHDATVARLAVDEALDRGDRARAERRATRGHVSLAEVAARAVLLEKRELGTELAKELLAADPNDGCAAMVVNGHGERSPDHPPAACVLLMTRRLADTSLEAARLFLQRVQPEPIAPHDPLVGPVAVELAVRGAIADKALPIELRLETAARRRDAPPAIDPALVDAKHALLFHALVDPTGAPARTLLVKLSGATDRDPLVGFALARAVLAASPRAPVDALAKVRAAIAAAPADPLMLAAAVELAKKAGQPDELPPARARLMAVARTPAERALAQP